MYRDWRKKKLREEEMAVEMSWVNMKEIVFREVRYTFTLVKGTTNLYSFSGV